MIVALTAWENRISPVFDESRSLLVAHIHDGKVVKCFFEHFNPSIRWHLIEMLNVLKIDVLICGAISEVSLKIIESTDIKVIPFIGGKIDEILELFIKKNQIPPDIIMPGFGNIHNKIIKIRKSV